MDRAGVSIEDAVALIISVKKINRAQETGWIFYVTSKLIFGVLKLRPYMKKKWTDPSVNCWWTVSQQLAVYQQTADSVLTNENMSYLKVASCCKHHFFMVVFIVNHCNLFFFILKPPILGSRIQQDQYSSNSSTLPWNKCIIQIAWFYGWTNILDSGFVIINENLLFRFRFSDSMTICLKQICGYTDLCCEVEKLRKEAYSSDNATHEEKLMQVWVNYYNV